MSPAGFTTGHSAFKVPGIGGLAIGVASATLASVFLDPLSKFNANVPIHVWTRRYAVAVIVQGAILVILIPWLFAVCPLQTATVFEFLRGSNALAYVVSQVFLLYLTVLRLQVVASNNVAKSAGRIMIVVGFLGTLYSASVATANVFPKSASLALIVVSFTALIVAFVAFQCYAYFFFARVAHNASEEAKLNESDTHAIATAKRARALVAFLVLSAGKVDPEKEVRP